MAFSAHKDPEMVEEHFSDEKTLDAQSEQVARLIRGAKHFVCFTGAGVSTSAGIPDFRGPRGVWTMRAKGQETVAETSLSKASPTPTHMSLVSLQRNGYLKYLISQNVDGLHRRSGFPTEKLAELHGNDNLEYCQRCKREYFRDFSTEADDPDDVCDHRTGRKCQCGGELMDTMIHFGENLPEKPLENSFVNSQTADLCLVLGSSLTVTPANEMPRRTVENGGKLVICNLQRTPLDELANIRVFAKTDDFMVKVLAKLNLHVDRWRLVRHVNVHVYRLDVENRIKINVSGVDSDGIPASIFSKVTINNFNGTSKNISLKSEPFVFEIPYRSRREALKFQLILYFMGNYNEPSLTQQILCDHPLIDKSIKFVLAFDPRTGSWETL